MNTQQITIAKTTHTDMSVGYTMSIVTEGFERIIKLKAYQYKEMKRTNVFNCIERNLSQSNVSA
jgi:hypothetical protein